jgi:hypothetical protein
MKNKIFCYVTIIFIFFSIPLIATELELDNYMKNKYDSFLLTIDTTLSGNEILELFKESITDADKMIMIEMSQNHTSNWDEQFGTMQSKTGIIDTVILQIECNNGFNSLVKIIWWDGLPRKGYFTNCNGSVDSIFYFANNVNPPMHTLKTMLPKITDSLFIYANENNTKLQIIDVLTGVLVQESIMTASQPIRTETVNMPIGQPITHTVMPPYSFQNISIAGVSEGWYFFTILNSNNEVIYIKTFKK